MTTKQDKTQEENSQILSRQNKKMTVFKCSCGARILIVPDLPEMDKVIQKHLMEHKRKTGQQLNEETLIQLIVEAITENQS
jgi:hypothetical protein